MKLLEEETNLSIPTDECAALVADTIPLVMRTIRAEMRKHRTAGLSVPQFRALAFLGRQAGASLSDVADHIGLTMPSISKMIDRLVVRGLVVRRSALTDRRRVSLELTPQGEATLQAAASATRARLTEHLAALSPNERATVAQAMQNLRAVFSSPLPVETDNNSKE